MRSPINWVGGKGNMVAKLLKYIPPHYVYVEVFGGGASLLFAKKPSPVEVYNDIDVNLVNFFRTLQDPEKFYKMYFKASLTPYSRAEYYYFRDTWEKCQDDIEKVYRWFVVARMSFGGHFANSWAFNVTASYRNMTGAVSKWLSTLELLPDIHERLRNVRIENLDFREIIPLYDGPDTFFYLDPPYLPTTRKTSKMYDHEMSCQDHEELVNIILKTKGMVMLSGYQNDLYAELEKDGWVRKDFKTACHTAGRTRQTNILGKGSARAKVPRVESIWLNPSLIKRLEVITCVLEGI